MLVAAARRVAWVATSHYAADFPTFDHGAGQGSAQLALNQLAVLCGIPFASEKCRLMAVVQQFIGHFFDLSRFLQRVMVIRPKERRAEQIKDPCYEAIDQNSMSTGKCTKIRGLVQ